VNRHFYVWNLQNRGVKKYVTPDSTSVTSQNDGFIGKRGTVNDYISGLKNSKRGSRACLTGSPKRRKTGSKPSKKLVEKEVANGVKARINCLMRF